jgi:hypothetical protein
MLGAFAILEFDDETSACATALRTSRPAAPSREKPLRLWTIIDEAALHRRVGGSQRREPERRGRGRAGELGDVGFGG